MTLIRTVSSDVEALEPPLHLRVGTLNCWGLCFSPDRHVRFHNIAQVLKSSALDIVALQEVWRISDWLKLRHDLAFQYPYAEHYSTGIIGSGLAILSKWPIAQIAWHKFSLNGAPNWIHHGDWFAGKGVAMARIVVDEKYVVDVYNSHTHAEYCKTKLRYLLHQMSQLCELRRMIETFSSRSYFQKGHFDDKEQKTPFSLAQQQPSLVLAMGDWNCWSDGLAYETVIKNGAMVSFDGNFMPLIDAWLEHYLEQDNDKKLSGVNFNQVGCTYNSKESKYHIRGDPEERLDYVHYHNFTSVNEKGQKTWGCTSTEIVSKSATGQWLSDHAMLIVTFGPKKAKSNPNHDVQEDLSSHYTKLKLHNQHILSYVERDLKNLRIRQLFFRLFWITFLIIFLGLFATGSLASLHPNWNISFRARLIIFIISPVFLLLTFMCALVSEMFLRDERAGVKMIAQQWTSWYRASIARFTSTSSMIK